MITASRLDLARRCPGAFALEHFDQSNEFQEEGVDRHRAFEERIERGDIPERLLERWPSATWRAEVRFAFCLATGVGRELPGDGHRDYSQAGALEICGTADAVGRLGDLLIVVDFKSHDPNVQRAHVNAQVHIAALALSRAYKLDDAEVAIHHEVRPLDVHRLDCLDLEVFAGEARGIIEDVARVKAEHRAGAPLQLSAGYWCRWCPAMASCPVYAEAALVARSGVPEMKSLSNDDDAAKAYEFLKRVKMLTARLTSALYARAAERPIPLADGKWFGKVSGLGNRKIDGDKAYETIRAKYGQTVADLAVSREASQKSIETAIKTIAPRGSLASMKESIMKELESIGGVTRKPTESIEEYDGKPLQLAAVTP